MDVSVIIINWNTREIVQDCLQSVYEQAGDIKFEVIVIDNASADGSTEMVKQNYPAVILIENSENLGFAAANNQGIAIAKGRYILLLNSDTVILGNAVAKTVRFADAHPDAAVVTCRVLSQDRNLQPTCFMFPSLLNLLLSSSYLYKLFPKSKFFGREHMTWWNRLDEREVDVATGCFMLVRKEAIEQVGMLDETFFVYGEETDWCYRFKQAEWKILFTPSAEIIHLHGASSCNAKPAMVLQRRASILFFFKKHYGTLAYRLACIGYACDALLRLPYWFARSFSLKGIHTENWLRTKILFSAFIKSLIGWKALRYK